MAFPPLICRCLMQPAAVATLNCPAALLPTLVGGRSFHNGKFVAKALTFEACCVAPGIWQTRDRRKFGGKKMSNRFTQYILIAMALGIVMGTLVFNYLPDIRADIAADVNLIAMMFLRLIKMIIAPLVFATLVGGIAHMGTGSKLGRIFAKTMGWFVSASFVSLRLGLVMVNLLQPGANFPGTLPDKAQSTGLPVSAFSIEKFLTHLIPTSIADAMAQNEILQIVIFGVLFGGDGRHARALQADAGADRRPRPHHAEGVVLSHAAST